MLSIEQLRVFQKEHHMGVTRQTKPVTNLGQVVKVGPGTLARTLPPLAGVTGMLLAAKEPIPDSQGFQVSPETRQSFVGDPTFYELSGPCTLVRLVQFGKTSYDGLELRDSQISGEFWFEEELLLRLMCQARTELTRDQAAGRHPFSTPLPDLIGNYVRHCLRSELAVSKDWTNDFDAFVRLLLTPQDRLTVLIGPVARQPAYSKTHEQHDAVVTKQIWLEGQATQYVIDFNFPSNRAFVGRILGPFHF